MGAEPARLSGRIRGCHAGAGRCGRGAAGSRSSRHRRAGRVPAVVVVGGLVDGPAPAARNFQRPVSSAQALQHESVVQPFGVGGDDVGTPAGAAHKDVGLADTAIKRHRQRVSAGFSDRIAGVSAAVLPALGAAGRRCGRRAPAAEPSAEPGRPASDEIGVCPTSARIEVCGRFPICSESV
jgi:hypothetical protein